MSESFVEQLHKARERYRQRDTALRQVELELRDSKRELDHLDRHRCQAPAVSPQKVFGGERWASFDKELQQILTSRLYDQHPQRQRYEAFLKRREHVERAAELAASACDRLHKERSALFVDYLRLRTSIIERLLLHLEAAPPPVCSITEAQLLSSWTDPLLAFCEEHASACRALQLYEEHGIPIPKKLRDDAPAVPGEGFRVGYSMREQWERMNRPWI